MKTNTDQESHTSWFRRIFGKMPVPPPAADSAIAPPPASSPKSARRQKVLIVDDDPLFLKVTSAQLTNEGFEVITARDGCEAIEAVRKQKPNLLLLDVNLPQDVTGVPWNGHRVISWLRHFESLKSIPVVMTSGGDPVKNTREALHSGATAFFHKRMNQTHLLTLVKHSLQRGTAKAAEKSAATFQI